MIAVEDLDRARSDPKTATFFPRNLLAQETFPALKDRLERDYLVYHFRRLEGSTEALCRFLKINRRQLYRRCERLGILDRKSTRLNSSHIQKSRMPSSA